MKERSVLSVKLISSHLVFLPLLLILSYLLDSESKLLLFITQTLLFIILLTGYWEFFGLRFRLIYGAVIEAFLISIFFLKSPVAFTGKVNLLLVSFLAIMLAYLVFELVKIFMVIFIKDSKSTEIGFLMKNGRFLITDGGNSRLSRLMNYHYYSPLHRKKKTNNSMKFATDIVRIGSSEKRFLPPNNKDYAIFAEAVYSPVTGIVIKAENNINDNMPYSGNYPYNTGNTVIIKNGDYYFLIGHLKKGSVRVREGDPVIVDDLIAEAGNSGYSERPHIHMQLIYSTSDNYWSGQGVGLTFGNKNLYKNRIIKV